MTVSIQQQISDKLSAAFSPLYLDITNESHLHSGPAQESHFRVVLVSQQFANERLLKRHKAVNQVLADELANHIHALALHTYTAEEWQAKGEAAPASPACLGGSKADQL